MCLCVLGFEFDSFLWLLWDFEVWNIVYAVEFLILEIIEGTSLAVQWLRHGASTAGGTDSSPSPGTKTHMPCGAAKKQKKKKKNPKNLKNKKIVDVIQCCFKKLMKLFHTF